MIKIMLMNYFRTYAEWAKRSVTHQNHARLARLVKCGISRMMDCALLHPSCYKAMKFVNRIGAKLIVTNTHKQEEKLWTA